MRDNQTIIVTQKNQGCLSGCGTAVAVILLIGLAVQYWYISLMIVVVAAGAGIWHLQRRPSTDAVQTAAPPPIVISSSCSHCGAAVTGNFCGECGTAKTRQCTGCEQRGLMSAFCPNCGSATYLPPTTY